MSDRIGGRPSGTPEMPPQAPEEAAQAPTKQSALRPHKEAQGALEGVKDAYEGQPLGQVQNQLQARLQALPGRPGGAKLEFTSTDLAYLAQTFAALIVQNPGAKRQARAKLFTRAILKRSSMLHMFAGATEAEKEQVYSAIADVLEGSPGFGQLIDDITEGTGKLG